MIFRIYLLITALISPLFSFHIAYLNMNNDELETGIHLDLAQFNHKYDVNRYFVGVDYLYIEEENNGDYDSFLDLSFLMQSRVQSFRPLTIGIGVKSIYLEKSENKFMAIPLTLLAKLEFPLLGFKSRLTGSFGYSPKPLTFKSGYRYKESRVEFGIDIVKRGTVIFGYRNIETKFFENQYLDSRFSESPYIGLKFGW